VNTPIPPQFGIEFLEWLRAETERAWDTFAERTLADFQRDGVGGTSWRRATRWTGGLSDAEIDEAERRYGLCFPADYRLFLRVLHATTPSASAARYGDDGALHALSRPQFFDWRRDDEAIRAALAWPLEGLLFDVEHAALWVKSWGPRPETAEARAACVAAVEPHVVLSVYQTDIIVYGNDLRAFLLEELRDLIGCGHDPKRTDRNASSVPFWGGFVS
jgi:hypothetical protein